MGTQQELNVEITTTSSRKKSWRDTLAADYEIQQARLRILFEDANDQEEFL
ncbi:hypothetical protein [Georgenia sp. H159]|uniref:hypothetical protein n=1 Tax=Georgenia sp. H159 TaxID=3076115 RepID=UPI002D779075|nr:hypothetical protein [Georgenia sp. H159]